MGWGTTMKTFMLAKGASLRQQKPFVSLERPEIVAGCKELYRVAVGGDHRSRYPFNGVIIHAAVRYATDLLYILLPASST
jgi:hypothetical protein